MTKNNLTSIFDLNDLSFDSKPKHSFPFIPLTPEILNKYRIKTLHKESNRPNIELSVSIIELEGLKSALKYKEKSKSPYKINDIMKSNTGNVSILSKSFSKDIENTPILPKTIKDCEKRLFWLNNRKFVKNFELLNEQKLALTVLYMSV